jgi:oligopeptide/dipeptide ABC transporter ATP-binding protein
MYAGREAETGPTAEVFGSAEHRYTAALLDSILRMETPRHAALYTIPGRPPDLTADQAGCPFAPRCPAASAVCGTTYPPAAGARGPAGGHRWHCHHPAGEPQSAPHATEPSR